MTAEITLERILALQAAYIRCIDNNELERWPDFFVERCLYKVTSAENYRAGLEAAIIYADTRDMLVDRVASLRQANVYEKQGYRHILGMPSILRNGGGEAECETPFLVVRIMHDGSTDVFASGVYLDTCRAEGSDLRFAKRVVVCDSSRVDTLMALPL